MNKRELCKEALSELIQTTMELAEIDDTISDKYVEIMDKLSKVSFKRNGRLTKVLARAHLDSSLIELSATLLQTEDTFFYNIIIHELMHLIDYAIHGKSNSHNAEYTRLGVLYGFSAELFKSSCTPIYNEGHIHKYTVFCPNCHHTWDYDTNTKVVKKSHVYRCNYCNHVGLETIVNK